MLQHIVHYKFVYYNLIKLWHQELLYVGIFDYLSLLVIAEYPNINNNSGKYKIIKLLIDLSPHTSRVLVAHRLKTTDLVERRFGVSTSHATQLSFKSHIIYILRFSKNEKMNLRWETDKYHIDYTVHIFRSDFSVTSKRIEIQQIYFLFTIFPPTTTTGVTCDSSQLYDNICPIRFTTLTTMPINRRIHTLGSSEHLQTVWDQIFLMMYTMGALLHFAFWKHIARSVVIIEVELN